MDKASLYIFNLYSLEVILDLSGIHSVLFGHLQYVPPWTKPYLRYTPPPPCWTQHPLQSELLDITVAMSDILTTFITVYTPPWTER